MSDFIRYPLIWTPEPFNSMFYGDVARTVARPRVSTEDVTIEKILEAKKRLGKVPGPIRIYEDIHFVDHHSMQTRYPKSKKKRIREKFRKKYTKHWTTPKEEVYLMDDVISGNGRFLVGHPATLRKIVNQFKGSAFIQEGLCQKLDGI